MKHSLTALLFLTAAAGAAEGPLDPQRIANTIVLDAAGAENLRILTAEAEEMEFEDTAFALGRIEAIPSRRSGVSTRTPGRISSLKFTLGDAVEAGAEVAQLESRQFGDPSPVISLKAAGGGIVTKLNASAGDPLEPETALMEITDLTEVHAVAKVPEHLAGRMKPGTTAHIRITALPEETIEGELVRFGTEADRSSGTLDALFVLKNPELKIRPGMRAEFSIVLNRREAVLAVPREALQGEPSSRFVFVKSADSRLKYVYEKSPVVVGAVNDRYAEILSGVLVADEVVTRGAYSLSFAGGSSLSLKEAMDAAHGHEHAEDGSELTPEKKAELEAQKNPGASKAGGNGGSTIWKYVSAILALVVIAQAFLKRRGTEGPETSTRRA